MLNAQPARIEGNRKTQIRLFTDEATYPRDESIEKLTQIADYGYFISPLVGLPELHYKKGFACPTGTICASRDYVVPQLIPVANNCGMSVVRTRLRADDITADDFDEVFGGLTRVITVKPRPQFSLTRDDIAKIFTEGAAWARDKGLIREDDIPAIENGGNLFNHYPMRKDFILDSIPRGCAKAGALNINYLGGGTHFIECHKVLEIVDEACAKALGLFKDQALFLMHTDSGVVGGLVGQYYKHIDLHGSIAGKISYFAHKWAYHQAHAVSRQERAAIKKLFFNKDFLPALPIHGNFARRYIASSYAGANFGYCKRIALRFLLLRALEQRLKIDPSSFSLVCDFSHVLIQKENFSGEELWVHRQGACRAVPKELCKDNPVFSRTGQAFLLPSSMGTASYICVADEGARESLFSTCHGTGRKTGHETVAKESQITEHLRAHGIRLYKMGAVSVVKHAPDKYKSADEVLKTLMQYRLARPVAKIFPRAVFKE